MRGFSKEFVRDFPSVEETRSAIEYLLSLDLEQMTDEELEKLVDGYFPKLVFNNINVEARKLIYRAHLSDAPIDSIKRLGIAPESYVTDYGRANRPGESIFYGANNFDLSAFEVCQFYKNAIGRNHVGEVTVGIWRIKKPLHLASIVFSPHVHSARGDIKDTFVRLDKQLSNGTIPNNVGEVSRLILEFFSNQFSKTIVRSNHEYKLSALYARKLKAANEVIAEKYSHLRFDGIMYPSVSMQFKGDNVALFKESFLDKIEQIPLKAYYAMCGNLDFEKGTMVAGILHEIEGFDGDKISWKNEIYRRNGYEAQ